MDRGDETSTTFKWVTRTKHPAIPTWVRRVNHPTTPKQRVFDRNIPFWENNFSIDLFVKKFTNLSPSGHINVNRD